MMNRPLSKARNELEAAREKAAKWSTEVDTAEAELESLTARSGAELVDADDPTAAARVGEDVAKLRARIDAGQRAHAEAEKRCQAARTAVVEACAEVVDGRAREAAKVAERHREKVDKLLAELADLDECDWQRAPDTFSVAGEPQGCFSSRTRTLENEAERLSGRADWIRSMAQVASDTHVDQALAAADPDGPEAEAAREHHAKRAAVESQHKIEREQRRRRSRAFRDILHGRFPVTVRDFVDRDRFTRVFVEYAVKAGHDADGARAEAEQLADQIEAEHPDPEPVAA